jgi:hypothetical protein
MELRIIAPYDAIGNVNKHASKQADKQACMQQRCAYSSALDARIAAMPP